MGDSTQWIKHIELYVNSSATPSQQAASVEAVAALLKKDFLTLETLVREMEMYLTTTDSIIRSRGILLLAEVLEQLTTKPLTSTSIHSLIGFFTERLADWKALRGAIVGCLALLRRKIDVGIVTDSDAKAVAQSYLENLQIQSLGQHDRKLSFQLMECLLGSYAGAIGDLGDDLVYGICEAIDGEKDPECLLLVFRIVESFGRLFPDPSGPLANFAQELFEILGCYFPIHFTHPKGEDDEIKKEELSRALMLAFASTPYFEPFSIPLLLEKLASSLPSAKVESFRYLSYCSTKYGPDRTAKHFDAIWSSIKDVIYISPQSMLSVESELMGGMSFQQSGIMTQAFVLLQEVIQQYGDFISLIISDNDINTFVSSLSQYKEFGDIPIIVKQRLHAVGYILSSCAKASVVLCNKVFKSFFPLLMDGLGLSVAKLSEHSYLNEASLSPDKINFGALYLSTELLAASRDLTLSLENFTLISDLTWCEMLSKFSESLVRAFISLIRSNAADNAKNAYVFFGVKGLQIVATFPGDFPPVSTPLYDSILVELVSIVTSDSNKTFLWTLALKALVDIGFFIDKCPDYEKAASFESTVVETIVSLISADDSAMSSSLNLHAAFEIAVTRKNFMLRVVKELDDAINTKFFAVYDDGNHESDKLMVELLDTYSRKVLPWFLDIGGSDEIPLNLALQIWDKVENNRSLNLSPPETESDLLGATMTAMKNAVRSCSAERQEIIMNKAFGVLSSSSVFGLKEEEMQQASNFDSSSGRDEWLVSLFASVVIALRPQTSIPNGKMILQLFIAGLLNGHVPSAHALGTLVNKLPLETSGVDSSKEFSVNEALDVIFHSLIGTSRYNNSSGNDGSGINFSSLRLSTSGIQPEIYTVVGLAWIGKGLVMRGHEKVKDVTMTLLSFLTLDHEAGISNQLQKLIGVSDKEDVQKLMKSAGDAFHIIMSDSVECLDRTYHATIRPLYKQRFFSIIIPILSSLIIKSESIVVRSMLHRAFAHVVSDTPLIAILAEAKKLLPLLLECLSMLSKDVANKDIIYSVLLVISGILLEKSGQETAVENAPSIINQLTELTSYSHMMAIRETAIQCLVAMCELPHTRIYPLRTKVLRAVSKALDDPKRTVRKEAVRCRQAWAIMGSRSLHF